MKPLTLRQKYPSEYIVWMGIKYRCHNKKDKNYGGRGIEICERWLLSFENFISDMGAKPSSNHQIDRKNNDGNYEPNNCVWATRSQNSRNRRSNRKIEYKSQVLTLVEWSERTGLSTSMIVTRLDSLGWSVEDALTTPKQPYGGKGTKITFNGKSLTLTGWARELGIDWSRLRKRLSRGWSIEKALTEPDHKNKYNKTQIDFDGEVLTIAEWSRRTGIERCTIDYRLNSGWTVEDTLTTETKKQLGKIEFNGEVLSVAEWSRKMNIDSGILYQRLASGMPTKEALTRPWIKRSQKQFA